MPAVASSRVGSEWRARCASGVAAGAAGRAARRPDARVPASLLEGNRLARSPVPHCPGSRGAGAPRSTERRAGARRDRRGARSNRRSGSLPVPVERLRVDQARAVSVARFDDVEVAPHVQAPDPHCVVRALLAALRRVDDALASTRRRARGARHRHDRRTWAIRSRICSSAASRCCIFSGSPASRARIRASRPSSRPSSSRISVGCSASAVAWSARWNASSASRERRKPRLDAMAAKLSPWLRNARAS